MTMHEVREAETGKVIGKKEIPDEIMEAAEKVEKWMREQKFGSLILHGLQLADY